jgi:hypothetical protein
MPALFSKTELVRVNGSSVGVGTSVGALVSVGAVVTVGAAVGATVGMAVGAADAAGVAVKSGAGMTAGAQPPKTRAKIGRIRAFLNMVLAPFGMKNGGKALLSPVYKIFSFSRLGLKSSAKYRRISGSVCQFPDLI